MGRQERLGLRLRDEKDERIARIGRREAPEPHLCDAPSLEMEHEACARIAERDERIGYADRLKELQGPRLDGQCA